MKKTILFLFLVADALWGWSQCADGEVTLSMNVYTDPWGYETYWEIVPAANNCGDGSIAWGGNLATVGCTGGGEQNSGFDENALPGNSVVPVGPICLTDGEFYTLYFVDDWGDGGLWFELFVDGSLVGFYAGSGTGNSWTFQAGVSTLGAHDSPCNALEVPANVAVELSNFNCVTQVNEIHPYSGLCSVPGFWCEDEMTHTVWAKFVVPDEGSYEVSTVHNGTIINTQLAVWVADDCTHPDSFVLVTANDDFLGDSEIPVCTTAIPVCVDQGSAAFNNVLSEMPSCCDTEWDGACQSLYDAYETSCQGVESCYYILDAYDTFGDGWNGGYVIVTVDDVSTEYALTEGNYATWQIPVFEGASFTLEFIAGGWPEEVYIALRTPDGVPLVYVQPTDILVYEGVATCNSFPWSNPQASRCYINCLPPGTECYIQVDGYDNQTGNFILTVKPFTDPFEVTEYINHVTCPDGAGVQPEGAIIAQIDGFGLNYSVQWTGPDGFESNDLFIGNLNPGTYAFTAADECGHQLEEEFVVNGPEPYFFTSSVTPTCVNEANGTVSATAEGGTPPYLQMWYDAQGNELGDADLVDLNAGFYYLLVVDANQCTIAYPVEVPGLEVTAFSLGEDLTICQDAVVLLTGPDGVEYTWSDGSTNQQLIVHADDFVTGEHEIALEVTNLDGCASEDVVQLSIVNCIGINEGSEDSFWMYPNPANEAVQIQFPKNAQSMRIYSADGRLMVDTSIFQNGTTLNLDIQDWQAGLYHCVVNTGGELSHRDLMITK